MKKALSILLAICLMISVMSGCSSSSSNSKTVQLTLDNYSDYLEFGLKGGGSDYSKYGGYKSVEFSGTITGLSRFIYQDVTVEVTCYFSATKKKYGSDITTCTLSATTDLNLGGNGTISAAKSFSALNSGYSYEVVECTGYTVTAISGTVELT